MVNSRLPAPLIAVTGPDAGGSAAWFFSRLMIRIAGGRAVRVTPSRPVEIDQLHGVVLGGGADIHPSRYKEELLQTIQQESRKVRKINLRFLTSIVIWLLRKLLSIRSSKERNDLARDELEFGLLKACVERKMPVLGICRGGQLINVFCGGSLHQSITNFYIEKPQLRTVRPRKLIYVEADTVLKKILRRSTALVNSLHNQSVKELGEGLRISARESNGVVQAIEHKTLPFMVGVQWHPEFLPLQKEQRRFFQRLVQAARLHRELCPQPLGNFEPLNL